MTHCLLFDSDGTLVDSEAINTEALADELQLHGIDEDKSALLARYRGWQFKPMLENLGEHHSASLDVAFEDSFRARASEYFAQRLEPIPNIHTALEELPQPKCVASNAPMSKLRQVLAKTGLSGFFTDNLFSAYDISSWKPDPGLFIHAATQMGFESTRCIVIEDSDVGVQAAVAAGMKCIHYVPSSAIGEVEVSTYLHNPGVLGISDMIELPAAIKELQSQA